MEKVLIGSYIRQKRLDKNWTQEFLCEGICDRSNLSRIENNSQAPSFSVLKGLLEKLGLPAGQFFALLSKEDIVVENLKKKIRNDSVLFRRAEGEKRSQVKKQIWKDLEKLEALCGKDDVFARQLALSTLVTIGGPAGPYSSEDRLDMLLEAIRLTVPRFDLENILEFRYTVTEVILVNKIARTYARLGDRKKAIRISCELLKYIEENNRTIDEYARQFCLVAYNCALDLAVEKSYRKAICFAEKSHDVGIASGYYQFLPGCLAIKGECYFFLGDLEKSKDCYMQAFYTYKAYKDETNLAIIRKEMKERLGVEMPH